MRKECNREKKLIYKNEKVIFFGEKKVLKCKYESRIRAKYKDRHQKSLDTSCPTSKFFNLTNLNQMHLVPILKSYSVSTEKV